LFEKALKISQNERALALKLTLEVNCDSTFMAYLSLKINGLSFSKSLSK